MAGTIAIRKVDVYSSSAVLVQLGYPGETLGYRELLLSENRRYNAEALGLSKVCFIEKDVVRMLLDRNPALGLEFVWRVAAVAPRYGVYDRYAP